MHARTHVHTDTNTQTLSFLSTITLRHTWELLQQLKRFFTSRTPHSTNSSTHSLTGTQDYLMSTSKTNNINIIQMSSRLSLTNQVTAKWRYAVLAALPDIRHNTISVMRNVPMTEEMGVIITTLAKYCSKEKHIMPYTPHTGEIDLGVTTTTWENESSLSQSRWTTCHHHSNRLHSITYYT